MHRPRWWRAYICVPDGEPGIIRITRLVAAQICDDQQQIRYAAIDALLAAGRGDGDALAGVDAHRPRLHLHGDQLVADWRRVTGDGGAIGHVEPGPDGLYRIGLGFTWYPVQAARCDRIGDGTLGAAMPVPALAGTRLPNLHNHTTRP